MAQLYEVYETDTKVCLVMEYCPHGELFDRIVSKNRLEEPEACFYFYQLVEALSYLHDLKIAHRDLKPENILISTGSQVKLIDFGLSARNSEMSFDTPCGSPCYAPPEMIRKQQYSGFETDVWSLGVTLFAMVTGIPQSDLGCVPFEDSQIGELYNKILKGEFHCPRYLSAEVKDLLRQMIQVDPCKRISLAKIR